jgi:hypothetical protein
MGYVGLHCQPRFWLQQKLIIKKFISAAREWFLNIWPHLQLVKKRALRYLDATKDNIFSDPITMCFSLQGVFSLKMILYTLYSASVHVRIWMFMYNTNAYPLFCLLNSYIFNNNFTNSLFNFFCLNQEK